MNKNEEHKKKCFCARCFMPVDGEDKVHIEGQHFHRICSMCCVCRTIPTSLKMFYGHVFCNECFKTHVLSRFRGESPRMHSNSWWMQWEPGTMPQEKKDEDCKQESAEGTSKKCFCARCLQPVDGESKMNIGEQSFHTQCAKCYFCRKVPELNVKIYYGQVFCEECFRRHVMCSNNDHNPSDFFKQCFDQWQNNPHFSDGMKDFMSSEKSGTPFVFMMNGSEAPHCRCDTSSQDWFEAKEPKKSVTPSIGGDTNTSWDLTFEERTEASVVPESSVSAKMENYLVNAAEKIEKLTKYVRDSYSLTENDNKKWKNFDSNGSILSAREFSLLDRADNQIEKITKSKLECPNCLWQCGVIYVDCDKA